MWRKAKGKKRRAKNLYYHTRFFALCSLLFAVPDIIKAVSQIAPLNYWKEHRSKIGYRIVKNRFLFLFCGNQF